MKSSMLGLLIAAGAFGASTVYLAVQLDQERARADQVARQTQGLHARIAELEKARAQLESWRLSAAGSMTGEIVAPDADLPAAQQAAATPASPPPDRTVEPPSGAGAGRLPQRSEAMLKMIRGQVRANFKRLNADLGDKIGLGKAETDQLVDLLVSQQMSMIERSREERGSGLTPEQLAAARGEQQARNLTEVRALIGADKMEAYQAYQESLPARQEVDMLSRQLDASDLGLSKDQRDALVTALAEERKRVPAPTLAQSASREDYSQAMATWQEDYNQRAAARAAGILDGEQQSAYADYQEWTREMRQQFEARRSARGPRPP